MDPVQFIDDGSSLALRIQNATGFAFPTILPFKETVVVKNAQDIESNEELQARLASGLKGMSGANFIMPLTFQVLGAPVSPYTLPVDPIINITGKNTIVRRYVSKYANRGTIKEYFAQDDYEITIAGILIADTNNISDVWTMTQALKTICENGKNGLSITNDLMNNYLDIHNMVVEDYDFPFTKGVDTQAFTIKGYSDDVYTLLSDLNLTPANV